MRHQSPMPSRFRLPGTLDSVALSHELANLADAFIRSHPDTRLAWCLRQVIIKAATSAQRSAIEGRNDPGVDTWGVLKYSAAIAMGRGSLKAYRADRIFFIGRTKNQFRHMRPVISEMGGEVWREPEERRVKLDPATLSRLYRSGTGIARDCHEFLSGRGFETDLNYLRREALRTAIRLMVIERVLSHASPELVVVSNQHFCLDRAVLRACIDRNIRTLYVPHAPVAANSAYMDLPVNHAALRGERERAYYAEFGIESPAIHCVGVPRFDLDVALPELDPDGPVVFALSPWGESTLRSLVELVRSATQSRDVWIAPHPTMDPSRLSGFLPPRWGVGADATTFETLRNGSPVLVQHSSGVALEALLLGVPTVELRFPGSVPNYPMIDPSYVRFAESTEQLMDALRGARRDSQQTAKRRRFRSWAEGWIGPTGRASVTLLRSLIEDASKDREGAEGLIYDAPYEVDGG